MKESIRFLPKEEPEILTDKLEETWNRELDKQEAHTLDHDTETKEPTQPRLWRALLRFISKSDFALVLLLAGLKSTCLLVRSSFSLLSAVRRHRWTRETRAIHLGFVHLRVCRNSRAFVVTLSVQGHPPGYEGDNGRYRTPLQKGKKIAQGEGGGVGLGDSLTGWRGSSSSFLFAHTLFYNREKVNSTKILPEEKLWYYSLVYSRQFYRYE